MADSATRTTLFGRRTASDDIRGTHERGTFDRDWSFHGDTRTSSPFGKGVD